MPNMNVSLREDTLQAVKAAAEGAGVPLSQWVEKTLSDAILTEKFRRANAELRAIGVDQARLDAEYTHNLGMLDGLERQIGGTDAPR